MYCTAVNGQYADHAREGDTLRTRREVRRVTANVDVVRARAFTLVHTHVIDEHVRRKHHRVQVDCLPVRGQAHVENNSLRIRSAR